MATQPSLRIGDRERDATAAELKEHFARGRLTLEEFNERLDAVFAAKTQADLSRITSDLPHVRSGGTPLPSSKTSSRPMLASGPHRPGWQGAGALAASWSGPASDGAGWTAAGRDWSGGDWSGRGRRTPSHGIGAFATLLAALASWLLVYDVILVGLRFPLPGRLGLLVAIFTVIRGLLRRIFRGGGRHFKP
jgi:Domain of unknown function (DUF1707)